MDGKTKEQVVALAQAKLQQARPATAPAAANTLQSDDTGVYITSPSAPSRYLPPSTGQYVLKLDGMGRAYVTDNVALSKYVSDFFPEVTKEPCRGRHAYPRKYMDPACKLNNWSPSRCTSKVKSMSSHGQALW